MPKAIIDKLWETWISKKLTVFLIGTIGWMGFNILSAEQWVNLAVMYIGTQGAIDAITKLRGR